MRLLAPEPAPSPRNPSPSKKPPRASPEGADGTGRRKPAHQAIAVYSMAFTMSSTPNLSLFADPAASDAAANILAAARALAAHLARSRPLDR